MMYVLGYKKDGKWDWIEVLGSVSIVLAIGLIACILIK